MKVKKLLFLRKKFYVFLKIVINMKCIFACLRRRHYISAQLKFSKAIEIIYMLNSLERVTNNKL